jgi:Family of unknown function (DUF6464)
MVYVGDSRCKYNALSSKLRCVVNPCGPCEGCQYFEPVRERIMFEGKPIAPMTRRDILVHNLRAKALQIWYVVRYPVGILQVICALTVLGLLVANKYPISKEHFLELFKSDSRFVGSLCAIFRQFSVLTEFQLHGRHRTFIGKLFRILEPLAWAMIFDSAVSLILK